MASSDETISLASFDLTWSATATSVEAVERALYAMADQVSGTVEAVDGVITATIYPRSSGAGVSSLQHRIRQEVIDQSLRLKIAARTDPIRNVVFAVAFSQLDQHGDQRRSQPT